MTKAVLPYIILFAVILAIITAIFIHRHQKLKKALPDNHIQVFFLYKGKAGLDTEGFMSRFRSRWKTNIGIEQFKEYIQPENRITQYFLVEKTHTMMLTLSDAPIPTNLIEMTISLVPDLDEKDRDSLRNHKSYIRMEYMIGPGKTPDAVSFAAKVLYTMLEDQEIIGFINVSAQSYHTRKSMGEHIENPDLDNNALFSLFSNIQMAKTNEGLLVHTHGMEQFGLPDIQILGTDQKKATYYYNLVGNAALYSINNGPVMKAGDTSELMGDGIIYRITTAKEHKTHPFGEYGALELSLDSSRKK